MLEGKIPYRDRSAGGDEATAQVFHEQLAFSAERPLIRTAWIAEAVGGGADISCSKSVTNFPLAISSPISHVAR